jgi:hypothetical protein
MTKRSIRGGAVARVCIYPQRGETAESAALKRPRTPNAGLTASVACVGIPAGVPTVPDDRFAHNTDIALRAAPKPESRILDAVEVLCLIKAANAVKLGMAHDD